MSIPATLTGVDAATDEVRRRLSEEAPGAALFPVLTALREALLNAVMHGCSLNPALNVDIALSLRGRLAELQIADPGPGFDWRRAFIHAAEPDSPSGRGLSIMNLYARAIDYNMAGNTVNLLFDLADRMNGHD